MKKLLLVWIGVSMVAIVTWCGSNSNTADPANSDIKDTVGEEQVDNIAADAVDAAIGEENNAAEGAEPANAWWEWEVAIEWNSEPVAAPNPDPDTVWAWDTIKVNYVWTLKDDGSVFDTSIEQVAKDSETYTEWRPYEPLEFTVGARQMIPGFDAGVVGMKNGEKKTIAISPEDGYGPRTDDAIQEVPSTMFTDAGIEPKVWEQIVLNSPMGPIPGTVTEIGEWTVIVDMNHFLAGKELSFEVTIEEITKAIIPAAE